MPPRPFRIFGPLKSVGLHKFKVELRGLGHDCERTLADMYRIPERNAFSVEDVNRHRRMKRCLLFRILAGC